MQFLEGLFFRINAFGLRVFGQLSLTLETIESGKAFTSQWALAIGEARSSQFSLTMPSTTKEIKAKITLIHYVIN